MASRILSQPLPGGLATAAAALFGLAAVVGVNGILNNYALGNPLLGGANTRDWPADGWSKELVVITGGSGGIGWALVEAFARRGIRVVVLDVQPAAGATGQNNVYYYNVDLTDPGAVAAVAARVQADLGDPTVLINNAGVARGQTLLGSTAAQIQQVFAVNAVAPLLVTREFLPAMVRANHGHVVTMASMASFLTLANMVDYSCSKAGLMAFDEGLRQELAHRYGAPRVRTSIVHPFWVHTPMLSGITAGRRFAEPVLTVDDVAEQVVRHVVRGRSGALAVPRSMGIAAYVRAFPVWLQEALRSSKAAALQAV